MVPKIMNVLRIFRRSYAEAKGSKTPIPVFGVEGRYVSALYSAAGQMNQLDAVEEHFSKLEDELDKPKVIDFVETSMLSHAAKAKLIQEISKEAGMPDAAVNFLTLVAENGRLKMLKKMIAMFLKVMVAHRNEAHCEVITAKPLGDSTRAALMSSLEKFVKGKSIQLTEKVDPSIIGGFIVGVDDKHIDMSIARRLKMYTDLLQKGI
ncbi:ATP synthase subunit O, mitochondrial [Eumeta japonica]|uniref:Oligomycin sensitivity conferral protein n=1 Tax=Eumeta variegata TaxID=151549 RepID=A0A4C1XK29_EUMVA|nr:ATP synthase subunit O, mitochondrial [Eumeta japonica]